MLKPSILITAGPTREYIDPVRYLSNASSGKMGFELARSAKALGCRVTLITGPVECQNRTGIRTIPVVSCREMLHAVKKNIAAADIFISAAAVSDYRPSQYFKHKVKKGADTLHLKLIKNPDILKIISLKKDNKITVGFSLDTTNVRGSAVKKLKEKKLDLVVANTARAIAADRTSIWVIGAAGPVFTLRAVRKKTAAQRIIHEALKIWRARHSDKTVY